MITFSGIQRQKTLHHIHSKDVQTEKGYIIIHTISTLISNSCHDDPHAGSVQVTMCTQYPQAELPLLNAGLFLSERLASNQLRL